MKRESINPENEYFHLLSDENCERAVIGEVITNEKAIYALRETLKNGECFTNKHYQAIYKTALGIADSGDNVNFTTIYNKVRMIDEDCANEVVTLTSVINPDAPQHARILADLHDKRKIYEIASKIGGYCIGEESADNIVQTIKGELDSIGCGDADKSIKPISEFTAKVYERVNDNLNGKMHTGFLTGFPELDQKGGFQPSDLVVIAASTSMGKTSFVQQLSLKFASSGVPVAIYSMEMTAEQLTGRLVSMKARIQFSTIMFGGGLDKSDLPRIDKAIGEIEDLPIFIDQTSSASLDSIISSARKMVIKKGVKVIFVDYMQILYVNSSAKQSQESILAEVSRRFKNFAKEHNITVVLLSQFNRTSDIPSVDRLRGSGQIAEAADMVISILRPEADPTIENRYPEPFRDISTHNTALISVLKGRNTGLLSFICGFNPEFTLFHPLGELPKLANTKIYNDYDF